MSYWDEWTFVHVSLRKVMQSNWCSNRTSRTACNSTLESMHYDCQKAVVALVWFLLWMMTCNWGSACFFRKNLPFKRGITMRKKTSQFCLQPLIWQGNLKKQSTRWRCWLAVPFSWQDARERRIHVCSVPKVLFEFQIYRRIGLSGVENKTDMIKKYSWDVTFNIEKGKTHNSAWFTVC